LGFSIGFLKNSPVPFGEVGITHPGQPVNNVEYDDTRERFAKVPKRAYFILQLARIGIVEVGSPKL